MTAERCFRRCYVCGSSDEELRPYGKNGQDICFDCMISDSEREKEAKKQFSSQLDGCGEISVIGNDVGPIPYIKSRD